MRVTLVLQVELSCQSVLDYFQYVSTGISRPCPRQSWSDFINASRPRPSAEISLIITALPALPALPCPTALGGPMTPAILHLAGQGIHVSSRRAAQAVGLTGSHWLSLANRVSLTAHSARGGVNARTRLGSIRRGASSRVLTRLVHVPSDGLVPAGDWRPTNRLNDEQHGTCCRLSSAAVVPGQ